MLGGVGNMSNSIWNYTFVYSHNKALHQHNQVLKKNSYETMLLELNGS
jgi:hypothetical protein